jgi:hypothetical protein
MDLIAESAPAVASTVCSSRWTDMWNRLVPAVDIVAADCRVYFGREPQTARPTATTGPRELQSVIDAIWERLPGIRYRFASPARYQADSNTSGIITLLWNVDVPNQGTKTGIDLLRHEGARITEVWSITGDLELPFMR